PAGPYFGDDGRQQAVRGFLGEQYFSFRGDATWSVSDRGAPAVLVARCDHRGDVALRNLTGPPFAEQRLSCRVPSGDHFEGALPLTADQARLLLAGGGGNNVAVRPSSGGDWTVGVLSPKFPDTMARVEVSNGLTGFDGSAGGTIRQVAPDFVQTRGLGVTVFCVRGVRLELRVSGRPLTTVSCDDDAQVVAPGLVSVVVPDRVATAAGMVPGRPVTVDVRSVGRQTGQWTVAIN
ncbi:MAG TPA: hypothetical protein VLM05_06130, partial [Mycobacteriales bacterium]|nr:hypothetical protein [Mycobacteriales bacterium]